MCEVLPLFTYFLPLCCTAAVTLHRVTIMDRQSRDRKNYLELIVRFLLHATLIRQQSLDAVPTTLAAFPRWMVILRRWNRGGMGYEVMGGDGCTDRRTEAIVRIMPLVGDASIISRPACQHAS